MCGSNSIQSKIARFEEEQLEIRLGKEFDNESVEFPLLHLHLKHCRNIGNEQDFIHFYSSFHVMQAATKFLPVTAYH